MQRILDDISTKGKLEEFNEFEGKSDVNPKDDYYCLSILYAFAFFFGWCRILEHEAFLEYSELYEKPSTINDYGLTNEPLGEQRIYPRTGGLSSLIISSVFNKSFLINSQLENLYYALFKDITPYIPSLRHNIPEESCAVPRLVINAIGDLMIKDSQGSKRVLSFIEFIQNYRNDLNFKKCLSYFIDILSGIERYDVNENFRYTNEKFRMMVKFYLRVRRFIYFQQVGLYNRSFHWRDSYISNSVALMKLWNLNLEEEEFEGYLDFHNLIFKRSDIFKRLFLPTRTVRKPPRSYEKLLDLFWFFQIPINPFLVLMRANKREGKWKKEKYEYDEKEF